MPFDGADSYRKEQARAILTDVQTYLATPGKWLQGEWSDRGRRHCLIGAAKPVGRRRKVRLDDNLARRYLCAALRRERAHTDMPEGFNDECPSLGFVLELVASAIEIVDADLAGQPRPVAPRCPEIRAWSDARCIAIDAARRQARADEALAGAAAAIISKRCRRLVTQRLTA